MPEILQLDVLDKKYISILNTFIEKGSCVLFLGPVFGIDEANNKIHLKLRKELTDPPDTLLLDEEFENLYISKKSDGSQDLDIIARMDNFYKNETRNIIYDKILEIGFRAVITYTSDLFLENANKKEEYDFFAFSKKGNDAQSREEQEQGFSKKPVIYNIFGNIHDTDTLIINYDSLYDFLLTIIKAEKEFPLQLRNILGEATAFLFLGFNLSKWYVPLIIRKLNQFIRNNNMKRSVSGFVCLDDTIDLSKNSSNGSLSDEIKDSLNKYPLEIKDFKTISSLDLIETLHKIPRTPNKQVSPLRDRLPLKEELDYFRKWEAETTTKGVEESLDVFFQNYKIMQYDGTYKNEFNGYSMQYFDLKIKYSLHKITDEDFKVGMVNVLDYLLFVIHKLI